MIIKRTVVKIKFHKIKNKLKYNNKKNKNQKKKITKTRHKSRILNKI